MNNNNNININNNIHTMPDTPYELGCRFVGGDNRDPLPGRGKERGWKSLSLPSGTDFIRGAFGVRKASHIP